MEGVHAGSALSHCAGVPAGGNTVVDPVTAGAVVAAPWVGKKLLGPPLDTIGDDLRTLYAAGRQDRRAGRRRFTGER